MDHREEDLAVTWNVSREILRDARLKSIPLQRGKTKDWYNGSHGYVYVTQKGLQKLTIWLEGNSNGASSHSDANTPPCGSPLMPSGEAEASRVERLQTAAKKPALFSGTIVQIPSRNARIVVCTVEGRDGRWPVRVMDNKKFRKGQVIVIRTLDKHTYHIEGRTPRNFGRTAR